MILALELGSPTFGLSSSTVVPRCLVSVGLLGASSEALYKLAPFRVLWDMD